MERQQPLDLDRTWTNKVPNHPGIRVHLKMHTSLMSKFESQKAKFQICPDLPTFLIFFAEKAWRMALAPAPDQAVCEIYKVCMLCLETGSRTVALGIHGSSWIISIFLAHVAHQQSHHQLLGILLTSVVSGTIAGEALKILIDLCFLLGSKTLNHLRFCFIKGICHAVPPQDHIILSDLKLGHGQGTHQLSRFFTTSNVRFRLPLVYRQGKGGDSLCHPESLELPSRSHAAG